MKKILIIMIITTIGVLADFSRSGNIVTDNSTNLQWQDDAVGSRTDWQGAIDRCEALSLDGFDDWRLPNKNELISILDYSKSTPSINSTFQNTTFDSSYWSSTSTVSSSEAWSVSFYSPYVSGYSKTAAGDYVRCVRGGEVVANYPTLKSLRPSDDINISIGSAYSIAFEAFDRDIDISSRVSCGTGGYTVSGTEVSYDANFSLYTSYENLYRFSCAVANNQGLVTEINQSIQVLPKNISRSIKESDILLDYTSKLMWEDSFEQTIEDNYLSPSEAVAYCNDLTLGNYTNWRVPSKYEWETMVNFYRSFNKKINYYWTSTAVPNREGYYYNLALFNNSYVEQDYKSYTKCVHDLVEEPVINTTVVFNNGEPLESQYININDNFEIEDINVSDVNDESITNQSIEVTHNIDNTQRGTYTITYSVTNSLGVTSSTIRKVKVISRPTIELIGDSNITIKLGSEINLGATAYDVVDGNLTYYIEDNESAIDTNQVGEYLIEYWVMNYHGYGATIYRTVNVVAPYPTLKSLRPTDDINISIGSAYSIAFEAFDGDIDISSQVSCGTGGYSVLGTDIYYNTPFVLDTSYAHLYRFNCAVANSLGFVTEINQSVQVLPQNISHDHINSGVLIDYTTKLMWQDDGASSYYYNLSDSESYCSSLTLGNYTNWRVPSKYEWETMINFNTSFNNVRSSYYWSNTEVLDREGYYYQAKLYDNIYYEYDAGYVKCVHNLVAQTAISTPTIELIGESNITIALDSTYIELGAKAMDSIDGDISNNIEVSAIINTNNIGTTLIVYSITNSSGKTVEVNRTVNVKSGIIFDNKSYNEDLDRQFVKLGSEYIEQNISIYDSTDYNLSYSDLNISGEVDTNTLGEYNITYTMTNQHGVSTTKIRTVQVVNYPTLTSIRPTDDINISIGSAYSIAFEAFDGDIDISSQVSCGTGGYSVSGTDVYYNTYFALDTSYAHLYRFNCAVANSLGFVTEVNQSISVMDKNISHDPINSDVLIDYTTKLMWQDNVSTSFNLSNAEAYCSSLTLGNYTNWRLPSKYEWETMINFNTSFNNGSTNAFRSNTVVTDNDQYIYLIKLSDHSYMEAYYNSSYYVKCVHDLR